jgi:hypothetical protein
MPLARASSRLPEAPRPPIRIRTVLLSLLVVGSLWSLYPRALAAWRLYTLAPSVANYALCMAGPTGPSLLRDNPSGFTELVRRRLIGAAADDKPFSSCAKMAREITGTDKTEQAHLASAWHYAEYGVTSNGSRSAPRWTLDDLAVSTRPLADLSRRSWPFVRDGYTQLVKPSSRFNEALHPVALPRPALGRGLPAWRARYRAVKRTPDGFVLAVGAGANLSFYRTNDGGLTWRADPRGRSKASGIVERCVGPDAERSFGLSLSDDGATIVVVSYEAGRAAKAAPLVASMHDVFAAACDDDALVAAARPEDGTAVSLFLCRAFERCQPLALPAFSGTGQRPSFPLDIARVDGTTIVSVTMRGIVRVTSSRDDGRTWTPFSVAYDESAYPDLGAHAKMGGRLLVLDRRVLLYGGAPKALQSYPVLVSDDYGASWRAP